MLSYYDLLNQQVARARANYNAPQTRVNPTQGIRTGSSSYGFDTSGAGNALGNKLVKLGVNYLNDKSNIPETNGVTLNEAPAATGTNLAGKNVSADDAGFEGDNIALGKNGVKGALRKGVLKYIWKLIE